MGMSELLTHDLDYGHADELDIAPPTSLLEALSERSGVELGQLRCMSFAGWVPWLFDSLEYEGSDALATYVLQFSVLLPRRRRKTRFVANWRAWLPRRPIYRACPLCMNAQADQPLLLMWQLPLMLSCSLHNCWLESYWGIPGQLLSWENTDASPRMASQEITAMDQRTWQALTTGYVQLPRRRIHAGVWFRLLRTLLDELNTPISQCGASGRSIRAVWEPCGYPVRAGQSVWQPYEVLDLTVQLRMLEAAAMAFHLIETEELCPEGVQAELLRPEPTGELTNGLESTHDHATPGAYWQETLDAAIIEARHNPEAARALFKLASYGCKDAAALDRLRATFAEAQIPAGFVSDHGSTESAS